MFLDASLECGRQLSTNRMGWDGGGESTRGRWLVKGSTILVVGVVVALLVRSGFFEFEGDDMAAAWEVFPGVQKRIDTYMLR